MGFCVLASVSMHHGCFLEELGEFYSKGQPDLCHHTRGGGKWQGKRITDSLLCHMSAMLRSNVKMKAVRHSQGLPSMSQDALGRTNQIRASSLLSGQSDNNGGRVGQGDLGDDSRPAA